MEAKKKSILKVSIAIVTVLVLCTASVLGTMAYLTKTTDVVTNTFTTVGLLDAPKSYADMTDIATDNGFWLLEHKIGSDADSTAKADLLQTQSFVALPGTTVAKDPFVQIKGLLQVAYLFIEVVESDPDIIICTVDSTKWTAIEGKTGPNNGTVYYYNNVISKSRNAGDIALEKTSIISGDDVAGYNVAVANYTTFPDTEVTIKFYGYLSQSAGFASAQAAFEGTWTLSDPE